MNRLAHSRMFLSFLLVVLQLALLPRAGRCDGGGLLSGSACSCASDHGHPGGDQESCHDVDATADSCCSKEKSPQGEDPLGGDDTESANDSTQACSCPPASVAGAVWLPGSENKKELEKHSPVLAPVSPGTAFQTYRAVVARSRSAPTPKAPTGPPLHLLFQVFLI